MRSLTSLAIVVLACRSFVGATLSLHRPVNLTSGCEQAMTTPPGHQTIFHDRLHNSSVILNISHTSSRSLFPTTYTSSGPSLSAVNTMLSLPGYIKTSFETGQFSPSTSQTVPLSSASDFPTSSLTYNSYPSVTIVPNVTLALLNITQRLRLADTYVLPLATSALLIHPSF